MGKKTFKVISLFLKIINNKLNLFFWLIVRFISAVFPLITVYLFSEAIKLIENKSTLKEVLILVTVIFLVRILDNYTRLVSIFKLEEIISDISFDIHNYFIADLKAETKEERQASIQTVRNFSDASTITLRLLRQPGIDSLVSLVTIPVILLIFDFRVLILEIAYILIYSCIDFYTTQRYTELKDIQNTKTESYFAKLQLSNDFELEQKSYTRHYNRLSRWSFYEWLSLQNTAVFFYFIVFLYLVYFVYTGEKQISDLVLIMGYITSTQTFLNSFSDIKDSLTDMSVALTHLAKNTSITALDLDDLM